MKKELWLLSVLSIIIIILICILIFAPAKKTNPPVVNGITITSPKANAEIFPPLKITGEVTGNGWAGFEGQVGRVELLDSNGTTVASGPLTSTTDWMKFPVNFETILDFDAAAGAGTLVFHNENPSGMSEKDKTFILPVKIK